MDNGGNSFLLTKFGMRLLLRVRKRGGRFKSLFQVTISNIDESNVLLDEGRQDL